MNPIDTFITVMILMIVGMVGILLWKKWVDIWSFFYPNDYNSITILESDNTVTTWKQKKNKDLRFEFNGGFYNMFESVPIELRVPDPDKPGQTKLVPHVERLDTTVYRRGRLGHFFYKEGNEDPIDFRKIAVTGNTQIKKMATKVDISQLMVDDQNGIGEFLRKYGMGLALVLLIIVIVILYSMSRQPVPVTPVPTGV